MDNFDTQKINNEILKELSDITMMQIEKAELLISLKYGYDFDILSIGDRLFKETFTAKAKQKDSSYPFFKAIINPETDEVKDNYISRIAGEEIKNIADSVFYKFGFSPIVAVDYFQDVFNQDEDNIDIQLDEFYEKFNISNIRFFVIFKKTDLEGNYCDNIIKAAENLWKTFSKKIYITGFILDKNFNDCKEMLKTQDSVYTDWFLKFKPVSEFVFACDGKCNVTSEKLQNLIEEGNYE